MVMKTRNGLISDFKSKLKMEEKSNGNEIKCDQCDKVLSKEKDLERHNKNFHLKIEDLVCEVCKKAFSNYKKLRIHKQVHMERKFPCDICGLKIKTKGSLLNHMESRHLGISKKPYFCPDCGVHFSHSDHKFKHMDQSERQKFTCDSCGKQFGRNSNLKKHEKRHEAEKDKITEKEEVVSSNNFKLEVLQKSKEIGVDKMANLIEFEESTIKQEKRHKAEKGKMAEKEEVIFSNNFKLEVLEKSKEIGVEKMAKLLGIKESMIKGWGEDDVEGRKVVHHPLELKKEVVAFALASSCTEAGRKYNIEETSIRNWIKKVKYSGAIEEEDFTPRRDYVQKKYSAQVLNFTFFPSSLSSIKIKSS